MKKNGFSLIELMVVLLVAGISATIAIPYGLNKRDRAREAAVKNNMHTLQLAAEDFATMCDGYYPVYPTTRVMDILNAIVPGSSTNPKRIADKSPGTRYDVSTTPDALLPGSETFGNPFVDEAHSLNHCHYGHPPVCPYHMNPAPGTSGSGTTYWHPCGSEYAFDNCTDYAIYGDGKYNMLYYELRAIR